MSEDPETLSGGNMGRVVRTGDRVSRDAGEWTPAVHRLLTHLRTAGVPGVPEPHGITADGREVVGFVEGEVPAYPMPPWVWEDDALESAARLLRRIHDATAGLEIHGPWRSPVHEPAEVVCHNDFAPYNLVFDSGVVVGVIDWDFASPGPRVWDLAYLAYRVVPLTTDDWGDGFSRTERRQRLRNLLATYGTTVEPGELMGVVHERLLELADFSDRMAVELPRPELTEHARLYRWDADHLPRL
jgi:aminoglycoside phosphotransferase (APT) family kinase protein